MPEEWKADGFQIAWFTPAPIQATASQVFYALTGQEPASEGRTNHPQLGPTSHAVGQFNDVEVRAQIQGPRADVFIMPINNAPFPGKTLSLDNISERLKDGISRADRMSIILGDANRLAIVLNLFSEFASQKDANDALMRYIGAANTDSPASASDLSFSINVPAATKSGLRLNRLVRWEVGAIVAMSVVAGAPQPAISTPVLVAVLDVNTVPGVQAFPAKDVVAKFDELADELCNLISNPSLGALVATR